MTDTGTVVTDKITLPGNPSGDKYGSYDGSGPWSIICYMVGIGALWNDGAERVSEASERAHM